MEIEDKIKWAFLEVLNRAWADYDAPQQHTSDDHINAAIQTFKDKGLDIILSTKE